MEEAAVGEGGAEEPSAPLSLEEVPKENKTEGDKEDDPMGAEDGGRDPVPPEVEHPPRGEHERPRRGRRERPEGDAKLRPHHHRGQREFQHRKPGKGPVCTGHSRDCWQDNVTWNQMLKCRAPGCKWMMCYACSKEYQYCKRCKDPHDLRSHRENEARFDRGRQERSRTPIRPRMSREERRDREDNIRLGVHEQVLAMAASINSSRTSRDHRI